MSDYSLDLVVRMQYKLTLINRYSSVEAGEEHELTEETPKYMLTSTPISD